MFELRPLLSVVWRNKTSALLIALQLALTLAVVSNAVTIIQSHTDAMKRPTGMAVEDIIFVELRPIGKNYDLFGAVIADLDLLRGLPNVVAASATDKPPLSSTASGGEFYGEANQKIGGVWANLYHVDPHHINTLDLKLIAGRNFTANEMQFLALDKPREFPVAIITQQFADQLWPGQNPLGKSMYSGPNTAPTTIVGIVKQHLGGWVGWSNAGNVVFYPSVKNASFLHYLVRTKPGKRDGVFKLLEQKLAARDPGRIINVKTLSMNLARSYAADNLMVKILSVVLIALSAIVALGIAGLTIFWITQRSKQIGIRRAIGATRSNICRYFLLENGLIATVGIALGVAAALILNQSIVRDYAQSPLTPMTLTICALLLLLVSLAAALTPALRAANISPATATRNL